MIKNARLIKEIGRKCYLDANRADAFVRLSSVCRKGKQIRNRNTDHAMFNSNINTEITSLAFVTRVNSKQIRKWIKINL